MKVKYYGHSCVEVEVGGKSLLFDPFISPNKLAADIEVGKLNPDYILLSHAHEDHVADAIEVGKNSNARFITNFEIVSWLSESGIKNVHAMNHGGSAKFDFGTVKYVNAVHSSTFADGSSGGNPGGFVVKSEEGNFYFAGDTALTYDMKLIAEEVKLNFAFLPIGDNFTMGPEDAVKAAEFIQCQKIVGIHYDTFPDIEINKEEAKKLFETSRKELLLLDIGKSNDL